MKRKVKSAELVFLILSIIYAILSCINAVMPIPEKIMLISSLTVCVISVYDIFDSIVFMFFQIKSREKKIKKYESSLTYYENIYLDSEYSTSKKEHPIFDTIVFYIKFFIAIAVIAGIFYGIEYFTDVVEISSRMANTCSLFTSSIAFITIALKSNLDLKMRTIDEKNEELAKRIEHLEQLKKVYVYSKEQDKSSNSENNSEKKIYR